MTVPVHYVPDFSAVAEKVAAAAGPGDVVVTMGAGDVALLGSARSWTPWARVPAGRRQ